MPLKIPGDLRTISSSVAAFTKPMANWRLKLGGRSDLLDIRPTMQPSRLTACFTVLALTLSCLAVPHWASTALGQSVPPDLAAQYGTAPSPALQAAIEYKIEAVKAAAQGWAQQGRDPSQALALMQQVPAAMSDGMSTGNLAQAEYLIDQAYALLMQ